jgi:hypothetical protein
MEEVIIVAVIIVVLAVVCSNIMFDHGRDNGDGSL